MKFYDFRLYGLKADVAFEMSDGRIERFKELNIPREALGGIVFYREAGGDGELIIATPDGKQHIIIVIPLSQDKRNDNYSEIVASGTTFSHWDNETRRKHGLPLKEESEAGE